MSRISQNARLTNGQEHSGEIEIALIEITHDTLDAPIRLSTDPTSRLSVEPLAYGTRSAWRGADPKTEPFLFVIAEFQAPSDVEDAPTAAQLTLAALDSRIAQALRSIIDRPIVNLAMVLGSDVDTPEVEFLDLRIMSVSGNAGEITLEISRRPIEDESVPMDRFSKDRFPGLFR